MYFKISINGIDVNTSLGSTLTKILFTYKIVPYKNCIKFKKRYFSILSFIRQTEHSSQINESNSKGFNEIILYVSF